METTRERLVRLTAAELVMLKQQADDGLWVAAETAPEAYLQQELLRIHSALKGERFET